MIYGTPADRNMVRLLGLHRRTPFVPVPGGGQRLQQPVHVEDLARAVVAALDAPAVSGEAYDVAGPEPLTFGNVIEQAAETLGRRARPVPVPLASPGRVPAPARAGGRSSPFQGRAARAAWPRDKAFDISAAIRDLGFEPRSFAEGIRQERPCCHDMVKGRAEGATAPQRR